MPGGIGRPSVISPIFFCRNSLALAARISVSGNNKVFKDFRLFGLEQRRIET